MLKTLRVISQRIALYSFNEYNNAMGPKKKSEIICRCNNVSKETIEKAIKDGAHTLNEIFDATSAGVGPCGGTCRRKLGPLLDYYLLNGTFPEKINEDLTGKPPPPKKPTSS